MENGGNEWPIIHSVGDVLVQTGFVLGPRQIPDYELVYFPEGSGTVYEIGVSRFVLDKPCFVFTKPGMEHTYYFDPERNVRHLFVHFEYSAFGKENGPFRALLEHKDQIPVGANQLVPSLMKQTLRVANAQGPRWKERITAYLAAALEELLASADHSFAELPHKVPVQIANAIAYMEKHLGDKLKIEDIALSSGWSHEHFTRAFVACMGMSPKRALLERRLRRAEQFLMSGQWTVKQIAFKVGFGDEHHFSKMYKSIRGFTASEYINRCKDPLFRHTAPADDPDTPYALNHYIIVNN